MGIYRQKSLLLLVSAQPTVQMLRRYSFLRQTIGKQLHELVELSTSNIRTSVPTRSHFTLRPFFSTSFPNKICQRRKFSNMGDSETLNKAKKLAAYRAVDDHVKDGQVLGIGSGTTAVYVVERIAQRVRDEKLKLVCIPTSSQAKHLIIANGLQLSDLDVHLSIDITIDGCDECDQDLNVVKGGGGCLWQEKIVASAGKKLIIVADYTKESQYIGENWKKGIPLEVGQFGSAMVVEKLNNFTSTFTGAKTTKLRQAVRKMGNVVTDSGHYVVDFQIGDALKTGEIHTPESLNSWLKTGIPGIVETGLFVKMANQAYFGQADGTVRVTKEQVYKNGI